MQETQSTTRFGVMGTGRITRRLVADLQSTDGVLVSAIGSRSKARAEWFAGQYGIAAAEEGYDSLLRRDDVDAVYIALPPSMHSEWCQRSAESRKHVLCEKPLAVNAQQVVEIHRTCREQEVRWLDATGWLHHSRSHEMVRRTRDGELGDVGHISAAVSFYRPFQSDDHRLDVDLGGGCLLDLGWYAAGLARAICDGLPTSAYADWTLEGEVPIRLTALLWFSNGTTAALSCGYDTATRKWFEVAGSEASLICDDFTRPWADRPSRYWLHGRDGAVQSFESSDRQEKRMIERFIGAESLHQYHSQAYQTQAILDALAASARSGDRASVAPPPLD